MNEPKVASLTVSPVEKSVLVRCDPMRAFEAFTREISEWWPLQTHSVAQAKARSVVIEPKVGGRVYEISDSGGTSDWGRVLTWSPPRCFSMTWHPGRVADPHTIVELSFAAEGNATRVRLVHRGWEALGKDARTVRDSYQGGWDRVFVRDYGDYCGRLP